jgi:hypothetical protein
MWAHVLAWWAEDPSRASRHEIVRTLTHFQLHGNRAEASTPCGLAAGRFKSALTQTLTSPTTPPNRPPKGDLSR